MTITEFARAHGVESKAVSAYMARHDEIKQHTIRKGKEVELLDGAVELLETKYPVPDPVHIINGVDPKEHDRLRTKYEATLEALAAAQTKIAELTDMKADMQAQIAHAEARQMLLEDKERLLQETKEELKQAQNEIARLRSRGLWERIRNR